MTYQIKRMTVEVLAAMIDVSDPAALLRKIKAQESSPYYNPYIVRDDVTLYNHLNGNAIRDVVPVLEHSRLDRDVDGIVPIRITYIVELEEGLRTAVMPYEEYRVIVKDLRDNSCRMKGEPRRILEQAIDDLLKIEDNRKTYAYVEDGFPRMSFDDLKWEAI